MNRKTQFIIFTAALSLGACGPRGNKPNIELIQDMMESPALKAQEGEADAPNGSSARVPPANTQPQGFEPYPYWTDYDGAAKNLKNPIAGQKDENTLWVGQKGYETQCAVCHGFKGEGGVLSKSVVSEKMAKKPPSLLSQKIHDWNDAQIYHVITAGQGLMGGYASHIPQKDRWQVVNYIRFLQEKNGKVE